MALPERGPESRNLRARSQPRRARAPPDAPPPFPSRSFFRLALRLFRSFLAVSRGRKLFSEAHASIRVPSTVKCSELINLACRACSTTRRKNSRATS